MPNSIERLVPVDRIGDIRPPLPTEHGAIVMAAAAVLTPLAAAVPDGVIGGARLPAYGAFVGLAAVALLLREAIKRRGRTTDGPKRQQLTAIAAVEALTVVALSAVLAVLIHPAWIATALLVPAVALDLRLRRRNWPVPFGAELSGVLALSLAVPAGAVVLGVGSAGTVLLLWVLFLAFHVGSVFRVGMVLSGDDDPISRLLLAGGGTYHLALVVLATAAWWAGVVGVAAPVVFAIAGIRTLQSIRLAEEAVELKTLGQIEGLLSGLFVLAVPLLLV